MSRTNVLPLLLAAAVVLTSQGCGEILGPNFPVIPSPRVIVVTPSSPASENITISFQLIDKERDPADIAVHYSTNGGQTFQSATLTATSQATGLVSDWYPGITHTVQWDSVTDMIGISGNAQVCVKVTPSDTGNPSGTADTTGTFTVDNLAFNQRPSVTANTPTGVQSGNVQITYTLTDMEGDVCSIQVEFSIDGGAWQPATMGPAGDGLSGLPSSPSGTQHVFLWDSRTDNVGSLAQQDNVRIRITPEDFHTGAAVATNSFSVDNSVPNNPPTVSITSGPANGSTIYTLQVTFVWSGNDTDGFISGYYYSFDRSPPDVWTTSTSVTSGILTQGLHTFRVVAMDNDGDFSTVVSRTFTVSTVGTIEANFTASPLSGTAPLSVQFTDLSTSSSGITSWSWAFGDGGTSTAQNPSHVYSSAGNYTVTLTVAGPDGTDTEAKTNYITVTSPAGNTIYVDGTSGNDTSSGLSWETAVKTIQTGLDKAGASGWTVLVANGTYTGTGNKILDFAGKAIHLKSVGPPAACIIDGQNDVHAFYFHSGESNNAIVEGFTIQNGNIGAGHGGAVNCYDASPTIVNCIITNNRADWGGGGIYCGPSSNAVIINCIISNNSTTNYYGGGINCENSSPTITNCTITNNSGFNGGGIYCYNSSPVLTNCLIRNNTADGSGGGDGAAIFLDNSSPVITNCTIVGTDLDSIPGIISSNTGTVLKNTVVWNSGTNPIYVKGDLTINCSFIGGDLTVDGGLEFEGTSTIGGDPGFVDGANGDYRLESDSSCVDAGNNDLIPTGITTDLDGNSRIVNTTVDIGAYEFGSSLPPPVAQFTASTTTGTAPLIVNFTDLSSGTVTSWSWDFDNDGTVDSTGQSPSYTYSNPGTYTVKLTVAGPGGSDDETKINHITVTSPGGNTIYVDGTSGNDTDNGLSWATAVKTIQTGLDKAGASGWTVLVANGTYTGTGNKNLDFTGKAVNLKSADGRTNCVIDCENFNRAFHFDEGETVEAVIDGFTILNGYPGGADGGAIFMTGCSPTIKNCRISANEAGSYGGAIVCDSSHPRIINCEIDNNIAGDSGGGILLANGSCPEITNCIIRDNSAGDRGGGIYFSNISVPYIAGCTISGNVATNIGGGIYCETGSSGTIADCTITANTAVTGGGIMCIQSCDPLIENCTIRGNVAQDDGGGIECYDNCNAIILNCKITENESTTGCGGGILIFESAPILACCTIADNTAVVGAGMYCADNATPTVSNCTIANNSAASNGGGIRCYYLSSPALRNTIIWGNTAATTGNQIRVDISASISLTYCDFADGAGDVEGGGSVTSSNCINLDPLFVNATAQDYHLQAGSPCIDTGDNTLIPGGVTTDLDGNPRIQNTTVDIGAYEYWELLWQTYTTADGLTDNDVMAIAIDGAGVKWFGTWNGGVSSFDGATWRTYTTADGLTDNQIWAMAIDGAGVKWFGTIGGGVSSFDDATWRTYTTADGLAHNNVQAIAIDSAGVKWFGTEGGGVSSFDGVTWRTYTTADGLTDDDVMAIAIDGAGVKWFGTYGGGVSSFDGTIWRTYTTADGLADNRIWAMAIDGAGVKWFGTYGGGVSSFDGATWRTYTTADGLADNWIRAIAIDGAGVKWFATDGGVSSFDGTTWRTYTTADGLAHNWVQAIAIDSAGVKWFGTEGGGVSRYSGN